MKALRRSRLRAKRIFDLLFASALLLPAVIITVPLLLVIRLSSSGPALFRQKRVGRGGKTFTLLKLRTMRVDTGDQPSHHASISQITSLGRILRKIKLDELPQIVNVLKGDMSFVGPRPCLPTQKDLIEARRIRGVHELTPGITGLAQVQGIDMSDPQKLADADQEYLFSSSFRLDLQLLARTLRSGAGDAIGRHSMTSEAQP